MTILYTRSPFLVKRRSQPMEEHRPKKLLDQVRDAIRLKHYSYRTEQAYVGWIKRYIYFHDVRHPSEMGAPEVEAFLTHLAVSAPRQRPSELSARPILNSLGQMMRLDLRRTLQIRNRPRQLTRAKDAVEGAGAHAQLRHGRQTQPRLHRWRGLRAGSCPRRPAGSIRDLWPGPCRRC